MATSHSACFGRERRLRHKRDFDAVFRRPSVRLNRGPLRLVARPNSAGFARLGVVVAKRMIKRAVARNRTKRAIREAFRCAGGLPAMDVIVRVAEKDAQVKVPDADRLFAALAERT